jgi:alanine racemase
MLDSATKTWVEISKSALRNNVKTLKRQLRPGVSFMAVVKSNAYGHGINTTVRAIKTQVDWFGVDSLLEAEAVAKISGRQKNILILGHAPFAAHPRIARSDFRQVVYDRSAVESLAAQAKSNQPVKVHLKIETGTSRQGMLLSEVPTFLRWIKSIKTIEIEGIYTHFANIEDTSDPSYAFKQLKRFKQAIEITEQIIGRPKILHTACSAAALLYPETQFDLVRVGISLYGLWSSELTRENVKLAGGQVILKPALTWKTRIIQVKKLPRGTPIGYGLTEKISRDSKVAILPIGYWDGYDRGWSSVASVLIHGKRAKILGRICMNMCVVDVTDIHGARPGDEVVLLGQQNKEKISAEELAAKIGTINYEVVTRINPLLPRLLVE